MQRKFQYSYRDQREGKKESTSTGLSGVDSAVLNNFLCCQNLPLIVSNKLLITTSLISVEVSEQLIKLIEPLHYLSVSLCRGQCKCHMEK